MKYSKSLYVLCFCFLAIGLFTSCVKEELKVRNQTESGCTNPNSFDYNPNAEDPNARCISMEGCLHPCGLVDKRFRMLLPESSLEAKAIYQECNRELARLQRAFDNIPVFFALYAEDFPDIKMIASTSQGIIKLGKQMYEFYNQDPLGISVLLAHAYAHQIQYWDDSEYSSLRHHELSADAFAGYYMTAVKQSTWEELRRLYQDLLTRSEHNANVIPIHGSPSHRLQALYIGYEIARDERISGENVDRVDLHRLIGEGINRII